MAVVVTVPNHYKFLIKSAEVDESSDVFKAILMNTTFAFDKDLHALLADVTANQIATIYGYTQNSKVLTGVALTEDDAADMARTIWEDITWTAAGGPIGPCGAVIIYDDTHADKPIVMCVDFGADFTTPDGFSFQIQAPEIDAA